MKRFITILSDRVVNRAFIFVGIILMLTALPPLALGQLIWNTDQPIGDNTGWPGWPAVAMSGNTVVALWRVQDESSIRMYSNHSADGGATWGSAQIIADNIGGAGWPNVVVSDSSVVAVWMGYDGSNYRVYSNHSADGGATWGSVQLIEDNAGHDVGRPSVAISGDSVVVVWTQKGSDESNSLIIANYSTDGGATWGSDQMIGDAGHNDPSESVDPKVAISDNTVVVVWTGHDGSDNRRIYSNHSTDGGATWGSVQLIEDNAGHDALYASVAVSGDSVVAIWNQDDGSDNSVYTNHSTDGGATWGEDQLIEDNTGGSGAMGARVAISGNSVVAVWLDYRVATGTHHTSANYSTDGGATWGADQFIAELEGNIELDTGPHMALSGQNAVIVWIHYDTINHINDVYAHYSTDGGTTWSSGQLIEDNAGDCQWSQVAISGDSVVAIWAQRIGENYEGELYANHGHFVGYEEKIDEIQEFFDDAVELGDLVGIGPTAVSAQGKLNALRNMLEEAEYLIINGYIAEACGQLSAIYGKSDGVAPPPDFIEGDGASALAEMILSLMNDLGCE